MNGILLHHNGKYNFFNPGQGCAMFESGSTIEQLKCWVKEEYGNHGLREFDEKLKRALLKGTSSHLDADLQSTISTNCHGVDETSLSFDEFVEKFLS